GACLLLGSNGKSDGKSWEWWKVAGVEGSGGNGAGGKTGYRVNNASYFKPRGDKDFWSFVTFGPSG
nr:hypothetical protein [Tanacetum cinerariifolium]